MARQEGPLPGEALGHGPAEPRAEVAQGLAAGGGVGDEELRRLRGRRRARVGGEIGERHVDLVPHGAHHGRARGGHLPHQRLVVEGLEVVGGASAATEDDGVDLGHAGEEGERPGQEAGRVRALHGGGRQEDAHAGAAEGHLDDVVDGGAVGAGDHADDPRLEREGPLALGGEEPLAGELLLEPLERLEQRPSPRGARAVGRELEPPARRVHGGPPHQHHPRPVREQPPGPGRRGAVHHAVDRRLLALVLEREVSVPARHLLEARDLPLDVDVGRVALDEPLEPPIELAHRDDLRPRVGRRGGLSLRDRDRLGRGSGGLPQRDRYRTDRWGRRGRAAGGGAAGGGRRGPGGRTAAGAGAVDAARGWSRSTLGRSRGKGGREAASAGARARLAPPGADGARQGAWARKRNRCTGPRKGFGNRGVPD